ncbi:MAG: transporter substrate-binding domain-containing protein [Selenomonadaceae bacterium]|nr:transporter substrate-binding domain-containing protein [Selenomonadaceae bacterium]
MKKLLVTLCAAMLLMTGCGGGADKPATDKPADNFSAAELKLGMVTRLNTDEKTMGGVLDQFAEKIGIKGTKHLPKFYDSFNAMQMGLESGQIEAISTYNSVANYVVANNDKLEIVPNDALNKITDAFCFAVRKDETALRDDLNKVIDDMKSDGSLDKLINDYVTNVAKGQTPPAVDIPKVDGAQTIKVGVTGDLPPLDLILADNSPAGFNTALLAEIAKRLNRNVEIVQIESGARAAALNSKLIDVVFWVIVPLGDDLPIDLDKPEGLELSKPYFKDDVAVIKLKANK